MEFVPFRVNVFTYLLYYIYFFIYTAQYYRFWLSHKTDNGHSFTYGVNGSKFPHLYIHLVIDNLAYDMYVHV